LPYLLPSPLPSLVVPPTNSEQIDQAINEAERNQYSPEEVDFQALLMPEDSDSSLEDLMNTCINVFDIDVFSTQPTQDETLSDMAGIELSFSDTQA
jgi:hypothetical protein